MSRITVYSTPLCGPCESLKQFLTQKGIEFAAKDLMMDEDAAERLEGLGIRSSPVLEIDGRFYTGAQLAPESLAELLGIEQS
ncbi:MAG TPA: glutaredoxin family protein [Zeimonas sp.]|nr:glutaredoxin family protein [Zeimonas sp.]